MTGQGTTTNDKTDEIDLAAVAERGLRFFKRFRWLFTGAVLTGMLTGILFYKNLPRVYTSRMILHSFLLTNAEQISIVSDWNNLLVKGEHAGLARELNCSEALLRKVKKIKASEIQQVFTAQNPNGFLLDVWVTDNSVLAPLQSGLVYGFENTEYSRERLKTKRNNLQQLIQTTTAEIQKLEETKKQMEAIIYGQQRSGSSLLVDGSSVNRQLIEMNEKLYAFQETLEFTKAIQVLQSFSAYKKPADPKLIPWLVIATGFFLLLASIYAIFRQFWQKIKSRSAVSSLKQ